MEKIIRNNTVIQGGGIAQLMDVSEFREGFSATRRAYLMRCKQSVDINGSPFLTFYFKTSDKVTIVGRKFNIVTSDILSIIQKLNKAIVDVTFTVQLFKGSYTLIVSEVVTCTGADPSPFFDVFQGAKYVTEKLSTRAREIGCSPLLNTYETASLFAISGGKVGAYLELLDYVYSIISARQNRYTDDIERAFFGVVQPYFSYLTWIEADQFVPKKAILDLVHTISGDDVTFNAIISDVLLSLLTEQKPEHMFSHVICNAFSTAKEHIRLERMVATSPEGLVIQDGDSTLIYY